MCSYTHCCFCLCAGPFEYLLNVLFALLVRRFKIMQSLLQPGDVAFERLGFGR